MESKEIKPTNLVDNLLDAREQTLRTINHRAIRPHGKFWGMDVFSWANPVGEELAATIHAFPFPIIWIGNEDILNWMNSNEPDIWSNVKTVIVYDQPRFLFKDANFMNIEKIIALHSIEDALQFIQFHSKKGSVLLFTATDLEWERNYKAFTSFIETHLNQK